jgi:hypothetical protein
LNNNSTFSSLFTASTNPNIPLVYSVVAAENAGKRIYIQAKHNLVGREEFRAYIPNLANPAAPTTSAEIVLGFNRQAPVVEMPSFFESQVLGTVPGSSIVLLTQSDEDFVITNAGLSTTPKEDYEFLEGTSGYFLFKKVTVDVSDRITEVIEYAAGATEGALAKKTTYSYTSTNKNPDTITEVPYTLTNSDLVTP